MANAANEANEAELDELDGANKANATQDNEPNELIVAVGQFVAEGQVAAEGHDAAKGQVAAEGQFAAEGQDGVKGCWVFKVTKQQKTWGCNNKLNFGIGVIRHRNCWIVLYSLTEYYAIFAEVKGYFRITAPDNQHEQRSSCSLRIWNQNIVDNQLGFLCSLRR